MHIMQGKVSMKYCLISLMFCLIAGAYIYADQVIYIEVSQFDPELSQFGMAIKGNTWTETPEDGAINGTTFGAPGDNNHGNDGGEPYMVIKVPIPVENGEGTPDGNTWAAWARLFEPEALVTADQFNSFFLRTSTDAKDWTPAARGSTALRWNDPGAMFPNSINGVDVLFTDEGDELPWFWEKHSANGQSTVDPVLEVGENYIEIGVRESDPINYPRIDVICLRNDGGQPSDEEAMQYLEPTRPGEPEQVSGLSFGTWGTVKNVPIIYIEEQHVDIDAVFNVDIRVTRAKNLAGFQIGLNYDPYNIQFIRAQEGKALTRSGQTSFWRHPDVDSEAGTIIGAVSVIAGAGAGGVNIEDDVLMTLTFRAKEVGRTMLSFQNLKLSDPESRSLLFLANSAFINISPPWDVVPDSVIDVLDMVAVGQSLPNPQLVAALSTQADTRVILDGENYHPDVDRNGAVNVDDLILVSNHFGEVYTEQNTILQLSPRSEARKVCDMLDAAPYNSPEIQKLKNHMIWLLAMDRRTSLPISPRLLPNYPNPFNPETWIPYHLAQSSHVSMAIYNISGQLMRKLDLGYREAGFYTGRDKAAHWNGTNDSGEKLASGLYFCVMQAGEFIATHRMLLIK